MSWRRADTEAALADALVECERAGIPAEDFPRELIDALYERGWSIAPTSVVLRGTL